YWDNGVPGPEMRATFSHGHARRPAGCWLPDSRFCLAWIDNRAGSAQLYVKKFYFGQESTVPETPISKSNVTPIISDFTLAAVGTDVMVAYVAQMLVGSNIYFQHWDGGYYWTTPYRLSYGAADQDPVTDYVPGNQIRLCWVDEEPSRSEVNSVVYDPVAKSISTSLFNVASSPWSM